MIFQLFLDAFQETRANALAEDGKDEEQFLDARPLAEHGDETDELLVVDRVVQPLTVFDNVEHLVAQIGVSNVHQLEILNELPLADYLILRIFIEFSFDLLEFRLREAAFCLLNAHIGNVNQGLGIVILKVSDGQFVEVTRVTPTHHRLVSIVSLRLLLFGVLQLLIATFVSWKIVELVTRDIWSNSGPTIVLHLRNVCRRTAFLRVDSTRLYLRVT